MDDKAVKRINLLEVLGEEHPDVPPPPEDAAERWTEEQIRAHYSLSGAEFVDPHSSNGTRPAAAAAAPITQPAAAVAAADLQPAATPQQPAVLQNGLFHDPLETLGSSLSGVLLVDGFASAAANAGAHEHANGENGQLALDDDANPSQPGGGRVQTEHPELDPACAPPTLRQNQLTATVAGYRAAAIAHGIPFREHGLFPPRDALLAELSRRQGSHAFEKHMAGARSSHQPLPAGGWTTGDAACRAGLDLRMFYQDAQPGVERGTLLAAARLGEAASIGAGCWVSAHGGAVESLLDEATAELAKMEWAPTLATLEAAFKIKKAVPLNTSLRVQCEITAVRGVRCWVQGSITDEAGKIVYATCEAQLIDLAQLWAG